ncbi:MAG: DUF1275 domain-containing protein [Actinomycetia bacterium]|nr:DUF1275 domain-containing protein [Actinomycetes bacterium]
MSRNLKVALVLLAAASGATDALSFLGLGQTFTAVVTGNLVLLGVAVAQGSLARVLRNVVVVPVYASGLAAASLILRHLEAAEGEPRREVAWPRAVTWVFVAEVASELGLAAGWWMARGQPSASGMLPLIVLSALSMGLQSGAVQRLGVSGLSTTYFTGTLTYIVTRLVAGDRRPVLGVQGISIAAMVSGALLAAVLVGRVPLATGFLPLALVGTAAGIGARPARPRA